MNVLVGRTDVGKSALIRGFRWLALNQPRGVGFVRWGKSGVGVAARTSDGHVVTRERKGKVNRYTVDGHRFDAPKDTVPPEVLKVLGMGEVNFQRQIDPPFWFTLPPNKVAKELNKVVDLSLIDTAQERVARSVRRKRNELTVTAKRYEEAKKTADGLKWAVGWKAEKGNLDKLKRDSEALVEKTSRLKRLVETGMKLTRTRADAAEQYALGVRAVKTGGQLKRLSAAHVRLNNTIARIVRFQRSRVDLPDFAPLLKVRTEGDEIAEHRRNLEMLLNELKAGEDHLCQATNDLVSRETELTKSAGNRCPTCGRSPFSVQTYISANERRGAGRKRGTPGSKSNSGTSRNSTSCASPSETCPW